MRAVRTLLTADWVDSTRILESIGDERGASLGARHDRQTPEDVARGAKPLEVEGIGKPVTARIMALGSAGQTLLSRAAAEVARRAAGGGLIWLEHGPYLLRGISEPLDVFEAGILGESPLRAPPDSEKGRRLRHNLPEERTAFIGRGTEIEALGQRFAGGARLVTITGPGGTGKTRLSLAYARTLLHELPGGVWFCDLTEARDPTGVAQAVARAFDLPLGVSDPIEQLGRALAARGRVLVVLDNLEQVVEAAARAVNRWLDAAPALMLLGTSRESLRVAGEQVLALEPLPVPDRGGADSEAVRLFVARAREVAPDMEVVASEAVAELVRQLDGMPLAIELAAARVRTLSPERMLERMERRFELLGGARRDAGSRHATLRAAIEWSWSLLAPWEQAALAQCSVFRGGFFLEAAEAVMNLSPWEEAPPGIDVVQALCDKSLLKSGRTAGEVRFGLYESIREHAAEKLADAGADAVLAAEVRHGAFFAGLGTDGSENLRHGPGGWKLWHLLCEDRENLAVAIQRALDRSDPVTAASCSIAYGHACEMRGPLGAFRLLRSRVLQAVVPDALRARLLAGTFLGLPSGEMLQAGEEAAAIAARLGDPRVGALALARRGAGLARNQDHEPARAVLQEAVALAEQSGQAWLRALVAENRGHVAYSRGELDRARDAYQEALSLARGCGDRHREGLSHQNLGDALRLLNEFEQARVNLQQSRLVGRETENVYTAAFGDGNLGLLEIEERRYEAARTSCQAAATALGEMGDERGEGIFTSALAEVAVTQGAFDEATRLVHRAVELLREHDRGELAGALCRLAHLRALLGDRAGARATLAEARQTGGDYAEFQRILARLAPAIEMAQAG